MNAYCATTSLSSRHVTRLYRSVHPSERVSEIRFVGKIAWMCVRETRLIVSLIQDTACCDQSTEASEADCQVSQLATPVIYLYLPVWLLTLGYFHKCYITKHEVKRTDATNCMPKLRAAAPSVVDVASSCMPARISSLAQYTLYLFLHGEAHLLPVLTTNSHDVANVTCPNCWRGLGGTQASAKCVAWANTVPKRNLQMSQEWFHAANSRKCIAILIGWNRGQVRESNSW